MSDKYHDVSDDHTSKKDLEFYSALGWFSFLSLFISSLVCTV
jgi:hypothetical protein